MELGPQTVGQAGYPRYSVLANKMDYTPKPIGVTIDWSTVSAVAGKNAKGTITVTAGSGNVTYTYGTDTTGNVAYNADAATIEAALEGLASIGNGNIRIAGTAPNFTYELLGDKAKTARNATFTSTGATIAATQTGVADAHVTLPGGLVVPVGGKYIPAGSVVYLLGSGKYGLADDTTSLVRGECFVAETHIIYALQADQAGNVFDVGTVIYDLLQIGGTGQPSAANFLAAFPSIRFFKD